MIEIPRATVKKCVELATQYSAVLNAQTRREDAKLEYHAMADSLVWPDELPDHADSQLRKLFVVLLQLRTRQVLSTLDNNGSELLARVKQQASGWAFFSPERFDKCLADDFSRLQVSASVQFEQFAALWHKSVEKNE